MRPAVGSSQTNAVDGVGSAYLSFSASQFKGGAVVRWSVHIRWILTVCFLLSGLCALVYEVLWVRAFTLITGRTVFSVSTVVAAFMAGLALGGFLLGRLADRMRSGRSLLRLYGLLEIVIGLYAVFLPRMISGCEPLFAFIYRHASGSGYMLDLARVAVGFLLLILPTTCMGGTLPVLSRFFCRDRFDRVGLEVGRLYALNTVGAALGSFSAGFVLLPWLGPRLTLWMASATNGVLGLVVLGIAQSLPLTNHPLDDEVLSFDREGRPARRESEKAASSVPGKDRTNDVLPIVTTSGITPPGSASWRLRVVLLIFFLSGCVALLYEVAWTRTLSLVVGPTVYAFSLMLTTFIVGLALGSFLAAKRVDRWGGREDGWSLLCCRLSALEMLIGLTTLALLPVLNRLPLVLAGVVRRYAEDFVRLQAVHFGLLFGLLLVPTLLMGMIFPIATKLYVREKRRLGEELGNGYAANTVGAIAGSLLAGFLFIPLVGTERTFHAGVGLNLLIGLLALLISRTRRRWDWIGSGLLLAIALLGYGFSPRWDPELLSAGAYKYALYAESANLDLLLTRGDLVYYKEGVSATVSVRRQGDEMTLAIEGKVDASDSGGDMTTQKLLAHLPLLVAEAPGRVCIIGLGSGVTLNAALKHPIGRVDVVELSPEVVEASRFFHHVNERALEDPRVRLIITDGRNHLLLTAETYDVIISEPSNPWMAGVSGLFTREFFQLVYARLTDRGIFCQWLHSYNMSGRDLKSVLRAFQEVFPGASLWALNENDLLLLGPKDRSFELHRERLERAFRRKEVSDDLKKIAIFDLDSLLSLYVMEGDDVNRFTAGVPPNSDDHPVLEFSSPRYMHARTGESNYRELVGFPRVVPLPPVVREVHAQATWVNFQNRGQMYEFAESPWLAFEQYRKALERNPRAAEALDGLRRTARSGDERAEVKRLFRDLLQQNEDNLAARLALAALYFDERAYSECIRVLRPLVETSPRSVPLRAVEQLAACYEGAADWESLTAIAQMLLNMNPRHSEALFYLATIKYHQGAAADAVQLARQSLAADQHNIKALNLLAIAYAQMGHVSQAKAVFDQALQLRPTEAMTSYNYGLFCMDNGWFDQAIEKFTQAVEVDPGHLPAYIGLAEAYLRKGEKNRARRWAERALSLEPDNPLAQQILKTLSRP